MDINEETIAQYAVVLDYVEKQIKALQLCYKNNSIELKKYTEKLYKQYGIEGAEFAVPFSAINRKLIEKELVNMFKDTPTLEKALITDTLLSVAANSYGRNTFVLEKALQTDLGFKPLPKTVMQRIVDHPFAGLKFSERLYVNQAKLITSTKDVIIDGLTKGKDIKTMAVDLDRRIDVGLNNTTRIVRTESSRVWNTCQTEAWKDTGVVEQVIFIATLDRKTSRRCQENDGQIFDLNDTTAPVPPLHPNCRSTRGAYFGELPEFRKNNENKLWEKYQNYEDWIA